MKVNTDALEVYEELRSLVHRANEMEPAEGMVFLEASLYAVSMVLRETVKATADIMDNLVDSNSIEDYQRSTALALKIMTDLEMDEGTDRHILRYGKLSGKDVTFLFE